MRKLTVEDSFAFSAILDKMGIQDDLNVLMDEAKSKGKDGQAWLGGQIVLLFVKRLHKAQNEVIELLASLFDKPQAELRKESIGELKNMITEIFKSEDFGSFFR